MDHAIVKHERKISPQLRAVVDLHTNGLSDFVMQLDPLGLETTKMMLSVLQQVDSGYWRQCQRRLSEDELLSTLDTLIKDPTTRQRIVQLYQASKTERLLE